MKEKGKESKEEWLVRWDEKKERFWKPKWRQQHKMNTENLELSFSQMKVIRDLNKGSYDEGLGIMHKENDSKRKEK